MTAQDVTSAVERVRARMAESEGRDWSYYVPGGMGNDLRAILSDLEAAEAALERIAHPEYGLGFNRLRGIARTYFVKRDRARTALQQQEK